MWDTRCPELTLASNSLFYILSNQFDKIENVYIIMNFLSSQIDQINFILYMRFYLSKLELF